MILGITGPEGSGKTCLMTAFLREHYNMTKGVGKIYAFPGYQLFNTEKKICSSEMRLADWVNMPDKLRNCLIAIDEIQNYFNSGYWNSMVTQLFAMVTAQRRKRNLVIVYTGQLWTEVPNRIRERTHVLVEMADNHFRHRKLERGTSFRLKVTDLKGLLTGIPYNRLRPKIWHGKNYWQFYDTYSTVGVHFADKVHLRGEEINITPDGRVIDQADREHEKDAVREKLIAMRETYAGEVATMYEIIDALELDRRDMGLVSDILVREMGIKKKRLTGGSRVYDFT